MAAALTDQARTLIDGTNVATAATVEPDGRPQQSLVWVTRDGDDVLFSTLQGRRKTDNLARDPRVTLLLHADGAPYTYTEIRGTATLETEGATELIDTLGVKYTGKPYDYDGPGDVRVTVRVTPDKVFDYS